MNNTPSYIRSGLLAGGLATICMSAVMLLSMRLGIQGEPAPKRITRRVVKALGESHPKRRTLRALTVAAHMGFGMGAGSAFNAARRYFRWRRAPVLGGILYALGIWVLSYRGWAPALGLMPRPEHDQTGRMATTGMAHLVYGAVLGACTARSNLRFGPERARLFAGKSY